MNGCPLVAVVVTWNSAAVIDRCLGSLAANLSESDSIVVVDNNSSDGTVSLVRTAHPRVGIIANDRNRGLPAANNQGIRASDAPLILICNPDVYFFEGSVQAMRATMARHPGAAWVVPRMVAPDGTRLTSAGDLPGLGEALVGRRFFRRRSAETGFWWDGWDHEEERAIGRGHEAAYLLRRAAVDRVGGQDERFTLDWEGIDWSERFRRAGWETWLSPRAVVEHAGGASIRQVPFRAVAQSHRGMYLYFAGRRPPWMRPVLAGAIGARALVKALAVAAGLPLYQRARRRDP